MHVHILIAEHTSYFSWRKSEQLPVVGGCYTGQQKSRCTKVYVGFPKSLDGFPKPSLCLVSKQQSLEAKEDSDWF